MQVNNSNPGKVKVASHSSITNTALLIGMALHNNRMQPDFGELALPSAADAKRYNALI